MANIEINGPRPETVAEVRDTILAILNSSNDQATICKALDVLGQLCPRLGPMTTVNGCEFIHSMEQP
jgi:hypothetical protein